MQVRIYLVTSATILSQVVSVGRSNTSKSGSADIFDLQCH